MEWICVYLDPSVGTHMPSKNVWFRGQLLRAGSLSSHSVKPGLELQPSGLLMSVSAHWTILPDQACTSLVKQSPGAGHGSSCLQSQHRRLWPETGKLEDIQTTWWGPVQPEVEGTLPEWHSFPTLLGFVQTDLSSLNVPGSGLCNCPLSSWENRPCFSSYINKKEMTRI